ncbi:MAG: hypothetical protein ACRDHM_02755 [Actinomycetota bacterium]
MVETRVKCVDARPGLSPLLIDLLPEDAALLLYSLGQDAPLLLNSLANSLDPTGEGKQRSREDS